MCRLWLPETDRIQSVSGAFVYSNEHEFSLHNDRPQVYGFDRSQSMKAVWAEKKANKVKAAPLSGSSGGHAVTVNVPTPADNGGKGKLYRDEGLDKSGGSGIIQEREYGISYGKKSVTPDMDYLESPEYKKKFQNATTNSKVNDTLYECALSSIKHRSGTYKEDMYIIHAETGEILAKQIDSPSKQGIIYNDEIEAVLKFAKENNIPIIAFHNHPEGYPPSVDDFNKAYDNNYVYGFAGGHNGQLYRYTKPSKRLNNADEIHNDISFLCMYGADPDRVYREIYEVNNIQYDIIRGE